MGIHRYWPIQLLSLTVALGGQATSAFAAADSVLSNSNFDVGVAGWTVKNGGLFEGDSTATTLTWSAIDSDASPSSGSGLISVNDEAANRTATIDSECISIPQPSEGVPFVWSWRVLVPEGQAATGSANVHLIVSLGNNCSSSGIRIPPATLVPGQWFSYSSSSSFGTARSYKLRLVVKKDSAGGTFAAHFDAVKTKIGAPAVPSGGPMAVAILMFAFLGWGCASVATRSRI